ncbi:MAG: hypothetical protein JWN85_1062 [Gammaproteobacteria bacterium]|nr:hypothetical protein [Gammaproteobacteria bacterium]
MKLNTNVKTSVINLKSLRAFAMSGLAVCAVSWVFEVQTASAANYTWSGPHDMRAFVSTSTPQFGCSTTSGNITWTPVTVKAATNMDVRVTVTNYLLSAVPGDKWAFYDIKPNASPNIGGVYLKAGVPPYRLNPMYLLTPSGRYYYASVRIDFYYASWQPMGTVTITPNTTADWASTFHPYDGGGYTYCYK